MRYSFLFLLVVCTGALADTQSEVIVDCDKMRTDPLTCTACNVYHEARGEPIAGQLAVALVTKNRVNSPWYPDRYCKTVWEIRRDSRTRRLVPMFSWTRDGKPDTVYNESRWQMALIIAGYVMDNPVRDITLHALWYHALSVHPYWKHQYYPTVQIGSHQFYTVKEETFLNNIIEDVLPVDFVQDLRKLAKVES